MRSGGSGGENCWSLAQATLKDSPVIKTTSIKTLKSACIAVLLLSINNLQTRLSQVRQPDCACSNPVLGTSFTKFNPAPDNLTVGNGMDTMRQTGKNHDSLTNTISFAASRAL